MMGCGLVRNRKEGKNVYCSIIEKVRGVLEGADDVMMQVYEEIASCVRYR